MMLYIVSTPIGNRDDITIRALKTLREVDLIFAEDTRKAHTLLTLYRIRKPIESYFEHNQREKAARIISLLREGKKIALISEAGTPAISDPGYYLIRECLRQDLPLEVIPGVSAVTAALVISGLPTDRFLFLGFLPRKPGKQKEQLRQVCERDETVVIFESPYRIQRLLRTLVDNGFSGHAIVLVRELTKRFQETRRYGSCRDALADEARIVRKGEFTVVLRKTET